MGAPFTVNGCQCYFEIGPDGQGDAIVENYSLDSGPESRCKIKCLWSQRQTVIRGLLGTVGYTNGEVVRNPPASYPLDQSQVFGGNNPNGAYLPNRWVCTSVGPVRGLKWRTDDSGGATNTGIPGWGYYVWALMEAVFTVPLWQTSASPAGQALTDLSTYAYTVTKLRTSGEVFSPPTGAIIYAGGSYAGKPLQDVNAATIRARTEMSCTLVRFPIIPQVTLNALIGSVNSQPLQLGQYTFPVGSCLFTGVSTDPKPDPCNFGIVQDLELTFLLNGPASSFQNGNGGQSSLDWNYFLDPTGAWVPCAYNQDPPQPVFAYQPLASLFSPQIS